MRQPPAFIFACLTLFILTSECNNNKTFHVQTETIRLTSVDQIELIPTAFVKPILYTHVSGLEKLPHRKAKAKFIAAVIPSILVARYEIDERHRKIQLLQTKKDWNKTDSIFFIDLKNKYRARDLNDLVLRIGSLPTSIVLAQAAVESGWGKSRFFLKANNLFGVWSFNRRESRIAAGRLRNTKTIYLRSYKNMSESIVDYFEILARSRSYSSLRTARLKTSDPLKLLPHLINYSERKMRYTAQLKKIILHNNFTKFDDYKIDPLYLVED